MRPARRTFACAIAALATGLTGCAGPRIYHPQLSSLDKGLGKPEVATRLGLPPLAEVPVAVGSRSFEFQRYNLYNGLQTDLYFLAFETGRLVFWGYLAEFRRQPDPDLAAATQQAAFMPLTAPSR